MRLDRDGRVALVDGDEELVQSIRLILATAPGERPMRPEFGCAIHEHVFAQASPGTAARIESEVRDALERWEPRIDVLHVTVSGAPGEESLLLIEIGYRAKGHNDHRNLVFPFYVIPEEGWR